jgi:hypothetical protein
MAYKLTRPEAILVARTPDGGLERYVTGDTILWLSPEQRDYLLSHGQVEELP